MGWKHPMDFPPRPRPTSLSYEQARAQIQRTEKEMAIREAQHARAALGRCAGHSAGQTKAIQGAIGDAIEKTDDLIRVLRGES